MIHRDAFITRLRFVGNVMLPFKGTVSRDGYLFWSSKHFNKYRYFLCMRWWFSRSFKSFLLPYTSINFLFASLKLLIIWQILIETLLRISFSVIGRCSLVPTFHWLQGKCARINLSPAAFGYILHNHSQVASCKHLQCQNRRCKVFEAVYWKDFQN